MGKTFTGMEFEVKHGALYAMYSSVNNAKWVWNPDREIYHENSGKSYCFRLADGDLKQVSINGDHSLDAEMTEKVIATFAEHIEAHSAKFSVDDRNQILHQLAVWKHALAKYPKEHLTAEALQPIFQAIRQNEAEGIAADGVRANRVPQGTWLKGTADFLSGITGGESHDDLRKAAERFELTPLSTALKARVGEIADCIKQRVSSSGDNQNHR